MHRISLPYRSTGLVVCSNKCSNVSSFGVILSKHVVCLNWAVKARLYKSVWQKENVPGKENMMPSNMRTYWYTYTHVCAYTYIHICIQLHAYVCMIVEKFILMSNHMRSTVSYLNPLFINELWFFHVGICLLGISLFLF